MRSGLLVVIFFSFLSSASFADEVKSTLAYRAKLMMGCDPELAAKEFALAVLVGQSVMLEPDHANEYNEAHALYSSMDDCADVALVYGEFVKVAKLYGNDAKKYWLSDEGKTILENSLDFLKQVVAKTSDQKASSAQ